MSSLLFTLSLLCLFLVFVETRAKANMTSVKIINGDEADPVPFVVSIQTVLDQSGFMHWCTGTLITPTRVLTAYHCFVNSTANQVWRVLPGITNAREDYGDSILFKLRDVIFDPSYNDRQRKFDVAIIRLRRGFEVSETIGLAKLASYTPRVGQPVTTVGWGEQTCGTYSDQLRSADGEIMLKSECQKYWRANGGVANLSPYNLCAFFDDGRKGVADADDGAPLMIEIRQDLIQVGFATKGLKNSITWCYDPWVPFLFTSTAYYKDFIAKNAPGVSFVTKN